MRHPVLVAVAGLFVMAALGAAQGAALASPAPADVRVMKFDGSVVEADLKAPSMGDVHVLRHGRSPSLIEVRMDFYDRILSDADDL